MGSGKWEDKRFGQRVKAEREQRGWSQDSLAKQLSANGINPMHATTVAKIEAGDRSVRISEAVGLADLFEVSLDSLLERNPGPHRSELAFQLRTIRDTARASSQQVWAAMETLRELLDDLPTEFDRAELIQKVGNNTWSNRLHPAFDGLMNLVNVSHELLRREQGKPELVNEELDEYGAIPD